MKLNCNVVNQCFSIVNSANMIGVAIFVELKEPNYTSNKYVYFLYWLLNLQMLYADSCLTHFKTCL